MRPDMNPYPAEPYVRVGLNDIYAKLLDVEQRLLRLENNQPLTNGHTRVTNLETVETDHEARIRVLEKSITSSAGEKHARETSADDTRANMAIWIAVAALLVGILTDILTRL